ncbi:MAG: OmpA family protein [Tepidisphaerales bacterium]
MAKARCKCAEVECEECPEWIFTLADLIMCMMGLFVILWCLKPGGAGAGDTATTKAAETRIIEVLGGIREGFGHHPDPNSTDPVDLYLMGRYRGPKGPGNNDQTIQGAQGTDKTVQAIRDGRQSLVGSRILFAPGQTAISGEATRILDEIVVLIRGHRNVFMVKGHADLDDFPDNSTASQKLDLSIRRAQVVADYLVAKGVEAETLRVIGCSTFEPVVQRVYGAESRQPNRRVEVQSLDQLVEEYKAQPESGKPVSTPDQPAGEPKH